MLVPLPTTGELLLVLLLRVAAQIFASAQTDISLATVMSELCPVRPRNRIQYHVDSLDVVPEESVTNKDIDYALFVTNETHLSVPKLELNYRIVVVGSSNTALSFLEHLIFK
ncbi:Cilia and flagella associated protein 61 [Homalodisca vitripennis]|nr:Cilia and flagella associated protein 61 [Homalodisca vitripennis]